MHISICCVCNQEFQKVTTQVIRDFTADYLSNEIDDVIILQGFGQLKPSGIISWCACVDVPCYFILTHTELIYFHQHRNDIVVGNSIISHSSSSNNTAKKEKTIRRSRLPLDQFGLIYQIKNMIRLHIVGVGGNRKMKLQMIFSDMYTANNWKKHMYDASVHVASYKHQQRLFPDTSSPLRFDHNTVINDNIHMSDAGFKIKEERECSAMSESLYNNYLGLEAF